MNIEEIGFYKIGDTVLREPPARDDCFKVVNRDADAHEYGDNSESKVQPRPGITDLRSSHQRWPIVEASG